MTTPLVDRAGEIADEVLFSAALDVDATVSGAAVLASERMSFTSTMTLSGQMDLVVARRSFSRKGRL